MPKPGSIARLVGQIKFVPIYTCAKCGVRRSGDTVKMDFDGLTAEGLKEAIDRLPLRGRELPVGWSTNGSEGFWCEEDTRKSQEEYARLHPETSTYRR